MPATRHLLLLSALAVAAWSACDGAVGPGGASGGGTAAGGASGAAGGAPGGGASGGAAGGGAPGGSGPGGGASAGGGSGSAGGGAMAGGGGGSDAGSDAGAKDAGVPDAGVDAGWSCPAGAFCDDFETGALGAAPGGRWSALKTGGTVALDDTRAFRGAHSVKLVVTDGTTGSSYRRAAIGLTGAPTFPVAGNAFYGRMRVWTTGLPDGGDVHYSLIVGTGNSAAAGGNTQVKYGAMDHKHFLANYWEDPSQSDCWKSPGLVLPEGRWACLEWFYDGAHDEARLWLDGAESTGVHVTGTGDGCVNKANRAWHFPAFDHLEVGWQNYQPWTGQTMWLDDFAMGPARLGCAP